MLAAHGLGKHPSQHRNHKVAYGACPGAILKINAADNALYLELHPRPPDCSLAQPLSSMASRDLHRGQNDADRFPGILGISLDRAEQSVAFSEMDIGDGSLRPSSSEERVGTAGSAVPAGAPPRRALQTNPATHGLAPFTRTDEGPKLEPIHHASITTLTSLPLPAPSS